MDSYVEFAHVLHQRVRLRVDPERRVLHGVTELYIRPGRDHLVALHARNLQVDEVRVGSCVVEARRIERHKQQSVDETAEHSTQDFADYVADDYRAALKAERTQGDLAIPLGSQHGGADPDIPASQTASVGTGSPPPRAGPSPSELLASDFAHCSETFRQHLLHDPLMAAAVKVTVRYRKLGSDNAVRYLDGLMTTDTQFNRARSLLPCVDLPTSLHTWELQVESGLQDVAVCSGALVGQRLLVGNPEEQQAEPDQQAEPEQQARPLLEGGAAQQGASAEAPKQAEKQPPPPQQQQQPGVGKVAEGDAMEVDAPAASGGGGAGAVEAATAAAAAEAAPAGEALAPGGAEAGQPPAGQAAAAAAAAAATATAAAGGDAMDVDVPRQQPAGEGAGAGPLSPAIAAAAAAVPADGVDPTGVAPSGKPPAAPCTPKRAPPSAPGRPRPYAKVWYYEQPVAVAPCQVHVTVGPLAVVPQYQGRTDQLVESFLKQQQQPGAGGAGGPQDSTTITHFGLPSCMGLLQATTRFFYLPFKEYQIASTVNFPLSQLQVVFIPSELAVTPVQVAAGCIVASSELLHSDTAVEAALDGKMALAEALAKQWFGVILQPRCSSDVWLVEGLAGLLADLFFKAWLGQNEVAYRRFKEREAVLTGDDGQPPPLCPQNQYDDTDELPDGAGGAAAAAGSQSQGPRRRRKDPLSQMYGSESLDPSPLRRWKAVTVLRMLEKRTGEDSFRSIMQAVCRSAANTLRVWSPSRGASNRLLSTRRFVSECGTAAGMAKDVAAFAERWVYGRGCPRLTAGFSFVRRNNTLLVALKQEGGPEVAAAGRNASAQRSKSETAGRGIKVAVYDNDGAVQEVVVERMEAHVDAVVHEIEITTKPGQRGRRKRAAGAAAGGDDGDEEGGGTQPVAAPVDEHRIPVQYFRVDPGQEWLCDVVVLQTESMWVAQLRNSKDVVAQSLAVQGLMRLGLQLESSGAADSSSVIGVLLEAVRGAGVYCRVRGEAARALAAFSASMSTQPAAPNLLSYFYDQCRDPASAVLRPNYWADLGAHLVLQAIPACLANIRDVSFNSTPEAMQLVTDILTNNDNSENMYDDSSYLAAVIEAAGLLRPTHASLLSRLLGLLDDYLLRDCLHPSHNYTVGAACLAAMTSLALSVNPRQGRGAGAEAKALELYACVRRQLLRFAGPDVAEAAAFKPNAASAPAPPPAPPPAAAPAVEASTTPDPQQQGPAPAGDLVAAFTALRPPAATSGHPHSVDRSHPGEQGPEPPPPHHLLRRAAYQCLLRLEAAEAKVMSSRRGAAGGGPEGRPASRVVSLALRLLRLEPLPALRLAVMMEALALLGPMQVRVLEDAREEGTSSQPGALVVPVSTSACSALYHLALCEGEEPRIRHLAFMALQLLTSQPPSLFRTSPDDALATDEVAAEPSHVTGRPPRSHITGHHPHAAAAATGPARSVGTAGQPAGTAGTAAAAVAAQAAPALKRIKMPPIRPGLAPGAAAAPAASAGGASASGQEGSAAGAAAGAASQPQASEAATTRSPARSPLSVALPLPLPQSQSQGPSADATAVHPGARPDGAAAAPSGADLTPSTKGPPPANSAAAAAAAAASAAVAAAGAPLDGLPGKPAALGTSPAVASAPSGEVSPRGHGTRRSPPRDPRLLSGPESLGGELTAPAAAAPADSGRRTVSPANHRTASPPTHRTASPTNNRTASPTNNRTASPTNHRTASPTAASQRAAAGAPSAQEPPPRAKPAPSRPAAVAIPPRVPGHSPGPSPKGAPAASAGRGPSPTGLSRVGAPPAPAAAKAEAGPSPPRSGASPSSPTVTRRPPPPKQPQQQPRASGAATATGAAAAAAPGPSSPAGAEAAGQAPAAAAARGPSASRPVVPPPKSKPPSATTSPQHAGPPPAAAPAPAAATTAAPAAIHTRKWPTARPPRPDAAAAKAAEAKTGEAGPTVTAPSRAKPAGAAAVAPAAGPAAYPAPPPQRPAAAAAVPPPPPPPPAAAAREAQAPLSLPQQQRPALPRFKVKNLPTGAAGVEAPAAVAAAPAPPSAAAAAAAAAEAAQQQAGRAPASRAPLPRRQSVAGSTGGPPPALRDAAAPTLPSRASASKPPPPPHAGTPISAPAPALRAQSPPTASQPAPQPSAPPPGAPLGKIKLRIKLSAAPPPVPAASTASAAPPLRPRPPAEADFLRGETPPPPDASQRGKAPPRRR